MAENNPSINLSEIYAALDNELDDLYAEGVISASIYNKKNQKRLLLYAISQADRHIALQVKLSGHVAIYVPAGQRTIFFLRQAEYVGQWIAAHSDEKAEDAGQYSLLLDEGAYLDVISVLSNYAHAYGTLPVSDAADPSDVIKHALPGDTENRQGNKYAVTGGRVVTQRPSGRHFYVEPNSRKMVLSEAFDSAMWLRFTAQIAPVEVSITELTKSELDQYEIRTPYWARQWLIHTAMTRLLSNRAASEAGYFDTEQKYRQEALQNRPGTGNVIIDGSEMDGNYEASFEGC